MISFQSDVFKVQTIQNSPDSNGIRVEALAAQRRATRMRMDSRTFLCDEEINCSLQKSNYSLL